MGRVLCDGIDHETILQSQCSPISGFSFYELIPVFLNQVKRISLSKNILRAIDANPDIPPLSQYPRSHQVGRGFDNSVDSRQPSPGHTPILYRDVGFPE